MSRKPSATTVVRPTTTSINALPTDICPVCKRVKYLNSDMEFLINADCYHPMCKNCVDNIFKSGPAQCPYASCTKTLRHKGFRPAFFADLGIEREVDIRRRVQTVFNQVEDDFVDLRAYTDYLQSVEDLTFHLISGAAEDRHKAEAELLAYEQQHRAEIEKNRKKGRDADLMRRRRELEERDQAKRRREQEREEEQRMRAEEATIRDEVMEGLARGEGSAADIQERILAAKRAKLATMGGSSFASSLFGTADGRTGASEANTGAGSSLSIRGLKEKKRTKPGAAGGADLDKGPYDPFGGLKLDPTRFRVAAGPEGYDNTWLERARTTDDHVVPGYSVHEYTARAMFEAFGGLGIAVGEEKTERDPATGTTTAAAAAGTGTGTDITASA